MPTLNRFDEERQAFLGTQARILLDTVPAASTVQIGQTLIGAGALVDGTYTCLIDLAGLANKLFLLLKATFGAGSVTTSGGSTMLDRATILTALTGVGAMATTVRQTVELEPITGEQFAILTIVVAGGAAPVFTEGECYGN